jgi:uncharacterized membrane protein YfcA
MPGIEQIAVGILAVLAAAYVRGLAGFGMAILIVPVLALAIAPAEAVFVSNTLGLLIGLTELRRLIAESESTAKFIALAALLATPLGFIVLAGTPPDLARVIIALVALGAFATIFLPRRPADIPGKIHTGATGVAAGLLTGFAGMPGPPVVPYYLGRDIPKHVARASMMLVFVIASLAGCISGVAIGVADFRLAGFGLALFPLVLLGNWLGTKSFGKVSDAAWRSFTGLVLGAAAFAAIWRLLTPS